MREIARLPTFSRCLFIVICITCTWASQDAVFVGIPGEVHFLENKPLRLVWKLSQNTSTRDGCYWEYDDPDPVLRPRVVLSYSPEHGVLPGDDIHGWTVVDISKPCQGIKKENALKSDAGTYKMVVGRKHSELSTVHVLEVRSMTYQIRIGNRSRIFTAEYTDTKLPEITVPGSCNIWGVSIDNSFPKTANISLEKRSSEGVDFRIQCNRTQTCEASLGVLSDVNLGVTIHTGIIDYPAITVEQYVAKLQVTNDGSSRNVPAIVLGVLLACIACVVLIYGLYRHRQGLSQIVKKKDVENGETTKLLPNGETTTQVMKELPGDITDLVYGLAKSYSHDYLSVILPHVSQHLENCIPEITFRKLVILLDTIGTVDLNTFPDMAIMDGRGINVQITESNTKNIDMYAVTNSQSGKVSHVMIEQPRSIGLLSKLSNENIINCKQLSIGLKLFQDYVNDTLKGVDKYIFVSTQCVIPTYCTTNKENIPNTILDAITNQSQQDNETQKSAAFGVAMSYCFGYLADMLPQLAEKCRTKIQGVNMFEKLIILIHTNCKSRDFAEGLYIKKNTELVIKTEKRNVTHMPTYLLTDPKTENKWQVLIEQPRILSTFKKMVESKEINDDRLSEEVKGFQKKVDVILRRKINHEDLPELILIEGTPNDEQLATQIIERITRTSSEKLFQ